MRIEARHIDTTDAVPLLEAFAGTPWGRRGLRFFKELAHTKTSRHVWVGLANGNPVGFGSLLLESSYPPFREHGVPEVYDLNVAPSFRQRGVASRILDQAEHLAFEQSDAVGVGFGLHPGYRAAQRLYVLRGYVPDGNGVFYRGRFPQEGEQVTLNDDLVLYLVKRRHCRHAA